MTDKDETLSETTEGGCPLGASGAEPAVFTGDELTYNDYLKVPELLALQIPQSKPAHHDEMLFIIIHQAYELWFKLILHEFESAMVYMNRCNSLRARHFVERVVTIMKVLVQQIHILETMEPTEFLQFRDRLMPASGFQSIQFREMEFAAGLKDARYLHFFKNRPDLLNKLQERLDSPDLRSTFYAMLKELGHGVPDDISTAYRGTNNAEEKQIFAVLKAIYEKPDDHMALYLLTESLVSLDEQLLLWRQHHVNVVERIIGFKRGTGGSSGVGYLEKTTTKKCFPYLWDVRTHLGEDA
jgi:tryptophan 2,3-dioxygenase